jgi:bifunctional pyridoxal-dependent enzyme with beta-cystathionase and maltose regulon repressor activities
MQRAEAIEPPPLVTESSSRKRLAFRKLAEKRTNAILDRIRILGNLANRSAYEYTDEELRKMFNAIEQELRIVKAKFQGSERPRFRLE